MKFPVLWLPYLARWPAWSIPVKGYQKVWTAPSHEVIFESWNSLKVKGPKSVRTCSTINFLLHQSYYWFVTLSILFSSPFSNSLICDGRSVQMKANLMPYLCNSVNNILVVILYGNHSLAFKHAQISNDLSLQSLQRKPRQQNKTVNLVLKCQNN